MTSRRVHKLDKSHDAPLISTHLQVAENESSEQSDMDGLPEREKIFQRNEVYNFLNQQMLVARKCHLACFQNGKIAIILKKCCINFE